MMHFLLKLSKDHYYGAAIGIWNPSATS